MLETVVGGAVKVDRLHAFGTSRGPRVAQAPLNKVDSPPVSAVQTGQGRGADAPGRAIGS